jgi:signal peptidase I
VAIEPVATENPSAAEPWPFRPAVFTPAAFTPAPSGFGASPGSSSFPGDGRAASHAGTPPRGAAISITRIGEELLAWFKTLVSAAVYATLIVTFGFQVARVEGESMAPTLENQDRLIVNKLAYRLHKPEVGDIVMLYWPVDPDKSFVKRVIAGPGESIRSSNGHLFRTDTQGRETALRDDFIPEEYRSSSDTWGPKILPSGYYFVMGDHRNNSSDSRTWEYVPEKYIIGKVELRWWPVNTARIFTDDLDPKSVEK